MADQLVLLNLPEFAFQVREQGQSKQIFDSVRKRFVSLTPEEWVRQHFMRFMIDFKSYPASLMAVEKMVKVNNLSQRADIVVYSREGKPWMIVECKAPSVSLSQDTFLQAARYNMTLNVPFFVLTNGLEHFCLYFNGQQFEYFDDLPPFGEDPKTPSSNA
ncbi:type I restriction enzyme HsdR N-terminal domain-containing protein [soil metagenome]